MNPRRRLMWKNKARLKANESVELSGADVELKSDEPPVDIAESAPKVTVKEIATPTKKKTGKTKKITSKGK